MGMIHQDGEVGDVGEIDMVHLHTVGVFDENAIVRIEGRERLVAGRERERFFECCAVTIDREIAEGNVAATLATQNGPALETGGRSQDGVIADDGEVMRAGRQPKLG